MGSFPRFSFSLLCVALGSALATPSTITAQSVSWDRVSREFFQPRWTADLAIGVNPTVAQVRASDKAIAKVAHNALL